jgi:hypothetical protein
MRALFEGSLLDELRLLKFDGNVQEGGREVQLCDL